MAKTLKQIFTEQEQNIVQGRFHPEPAKKPIKPNTIVTAEENINELSKDTLKSYMDKSAKDNLTSLMKPGMIAKKHAAKRFIGMQKAAEKLAKEEVVQEGRPSQRHPLEGHEYHRKSDEALIHIAKDAHKAAEAMKSHNTDAENKYRDQANDSATVRYFRKKNGMPEWYKKKYGHVKEGVVSEGENKEMKDSDPCWKGYQMVGMKNKSGKKVPNCVPVKEAKDEQEYGYEGDMAMNQLETVIRHATYLKDMLKPDTDLPEWVQSKITLATDYLQTACDYMTSEMKEEVEQIGEQMANAPFDPPYSNKTGTHTDKSGAKHGPMSVARDLARNAIAKQTKTMNKSEPTRKAGIVREAMKDAAVKDEKKKDEKKVTSGGKDKFQPDPEISTQIIRQE